MAEVFVPWKAKKATLEHNGVSYPVSDVSISLPKVVQEEIQHCVRGQLEATGTIDHVSITNAGAYALYKMGLKHLRRQYTKKQWRRIRGKYKKARRE